MKVYIILILVLFSTITGITQENKIKLSLNVSNTFMNCFRSYKDLIFDLTTIGFGIDIKKTNGNFRLHAAYGFNTYIEPTRETLYYIKSFSYKSHLLGLAFEYHRLNEQKRFHPFIGMSISSEIATNYKNGYIHYKYEYFPPYPHSDVFGQGPGGGPYYYISYKTRSYQSMPLVSTFYAGCNIKIVENLNLNLSLGYNLSLMNYKYVQWSYNGYGKPDESTVKKDYYNSLGTTPVQILVLHSLAVQLGLNYTFPLKKQK
ncbi:MAG: hypothetical protein J0G96_04320 [Flavobacteriia bacterium]|nr:hypothetical protein [Flavobacteriia bacterium]OJX36996.1 MAG: hypothetical protein BGO87_14550 [Flavobacteriia bacterium 40-80]